MTDRVSLTGRQIGVIRHYRAIGLSFREIAHVMGLPVRLVTKIARDVKPDRTLDAGQTPAKDEAQELMNKIMILRQALDDSLEWVKTIAEIRRKQLENGLQWNEVMEEIRELRQKKFRTVETLSNLSA